MQPGDVSFRLVPLLQLSENMEWVLSNRFCRCGRSPSPEWIKARLAASWMDDISVLLVEDAAPVQSAVNEVPDLDL